MEIRTFYHRHFQLKHPEIFIITTEQICAIRNKKVDKNTAIFDLPAGHFCKYAKDCKSMANRETGKIRDGENIKFRCFAASGESAFPPVRAMRWRNADVLKKSKDIAQSLLDGIYDSGVQDMPVFRIHSSGDFYSQEYFDAWLSIALMFPKTRFYAYTKSLPFWVARLDFIPENFMLNASRGGTHDYLIDKYNLKSAEVVLSVEEAEIKGLEIDMDDSLAAFSKNSFALLIHGTQPAKSEAMAAVMKIRKAKASKKEVEKLELKKIKL